MIIAVTIIVIIIMAVTTTIVVLISVTIVVMIEVTIVVIIITVEMSSQNVKLLNKFGKVNIYIFNFIVFLLFFSNLYNNNKKEMNSQSS